MESFQTNRMRIAYDHQIFSQQAYGGISRYFFEVARRIRTFEGYDVEILSPLFVNKYIKDDPALKVWGLRVKQLPRTTRIVQLLNSELVRWKLRQTQPDILHETYYAPSMYGSRIPRVTTVHDMTYELFPQYFAGRDTTAELKRRAIDRAERIIVVSRSTKRDLIEILKVPEKKVDVIYHGNSLTLVPGPSVVPEPYLLFVGSRNGYKNFELALDAFAGSPRLRKDFVLVCFGGRPFTQDERVSIRRKGLERRVLFDSGSDEKLARLYLHAEVFLYPSLYEGFGLPILEAMHYGCPVVCGNTSSMPEVAGEAGAYCDTKSAESFMTRIERLTYDSTERKRYSELGIEQERRFSWDRCARQTAETYHSI
jgi:glycosyltransferase involved in cell wall biosynthesis